MSNEKRRPPGPPDPPIIPGHLGAPSRQELKAMVATLGVFEWCEANGLLDEWSSELRRARDAFMFAHGPTAERWRKQTDEEPSWSQYAYLIRDNQRLREENEKLSAALKAAVPAPPPQLSTEERAPDPREVCTCGHTAHWHAAVIVSDGEIAAEVPQGAGDCEGGGDQWKGCPCKRFTRASDQAVQGEQ